MPASVSLEKLRLGLRETLARGDYPRREVDPPIDDFVAWIAPPPIPQADRMRNTAELEALRARALVLTFYCSGLRSEEATALETSEVLGGTQPGEADVRGKGGRAGAWPGRADRGVALTKAGFLSLAGLGRPRPQTPVRHRSA